MYIKLTRFDNTPIWINAAFVVTVEPRRQSVGSIVVPIGDGLDYEVRESPEQVLSMLDGVAAAAVVPVPPPKSLTKTPDDVSAEPMTMTANDVIALSDEKPTDSEPAGQVANGGGKESAAADKEVTAAASEIRKPVKRSTRKPRAKKAAAVSITDAQVERLRKMAPSSVKKLANTIISQLKLGDPDSVIAVLGKQGILSIDHDHVIWNKG